MIERLKELIEQENDTIANLPMEYSYKSMQDKMEEYHRYRLSIYTDALQEIQVLRKQNKLLREYVSEIEMET